MGRVWEMRLARRGRRETRPRLALVAGVVVLGWGNRRAMRPRASTPAVWGRFGSIWLRPCRRPGSARVRPAGSAFGRPARRFRGIPLSPSPFHRPVDFRSDAPVSASAETDRSARSGIGPRPVGHGIRFADASSSPCRVFSASTGGFWVLQLGA
jgi:hypothetical protein